MERTGFVEHKGKQILIIDFSNCQPDEILEIMTAAGRIVSAQPEGSVRTLTIATGAHYNRTVTKALGDYVANNRPFVKAAAVVGMTGLRKVVLQTLKVLTGRNFHLCETRDEALDYLARV